MYSSGGPVYVNATYWTADTRNIWNLVVGGIGRMCIDTPPQIPFVINLFDDFTTKFFDFFNFPTYVEFPDYINFILKHKAYTLTRRNYLAALHTKCDADINNQSAYEWATVDSFLKHEWYDEEKKPRWINPRTDEFKSMFGHIINTMDKVIYDHLSQFHVKNIDTFERMKIIIALFGTEAVTTTDFSSWEAAIKQSIMECVEIKLINRMFASTVDPCALSYLIASLSGFQRCVTKAGVEFITPAQRCSGELTTSSFNFLTDCLITLFSYWKQFYQYLSVDDFLGSGLVKAKFEGDDGIHNCPAGKLSAITYTQLGFIAKMEYYDNCYVASFCGQLFNPDTLVCYTNPLKFILRFGWIDVKYHDCKDSSRLKLLIAKAYSYAHQYPQCPIIYPICYSILRTFEWTPTRKWMVKALGPYFDQYVNFDKVLPIIDIDDSDREHFARLFRIDCDAQIGIERELIACGLSEWYSPTLENFIPDKFRRFAVDQCRFVAIDYVELDNDVQLH